MRKRTCTGTNLILNDNRRCPGADSETRECATWKCRPFCRKMSYIKNGQVLGGGSLEGDEISFVCNKHYMLVGEKALRCETNGKWNASEPKCKVEASWSRWGRWTDCSVSCDNGIQTRQRTCIGTNSVLGDNTLCGEKSLESRACANWKCPDCNKICTTGKLDTTCDACICDDNTLSGVVKDNTGILLENATIALAEFPFKILGKTGVSGKFVLKGFCISEDNIIVSRKGFLPQSIRTTKVNPTAAVVTAILRKIDFPEITSHPESKLRLEGQPITLCCEGKSSTKAKFEWTINDRGADEYQHDEIQSSKLIIPHVFKNMSGEIKCRVYDDHGAEFSDPARITVFNTTDDSCDPTPSQHIIALPQGCTAGETNSATIDVGECARTKCIARGLKNMNDCRDKFCCQPIATRNIKVVCLQHSFDIKSVTKCGCGDCPVKQTVVKGVARGGPDNKPFKYGYIYHGDKYLARTGRKGDFSFKVPGDFSRFVVTFKDKRNYNNFQELTKVIPLVTGRKTYIEVRLKPRPEPIKVDAKMGFEISLGNSQNTRGLNRSNEENVVDNDDAQLEPAVAFAVPPQGLLTEDGEIYNGTVKVEVNFVDPRNVTEVEEADGDFTTVDEDGEEQLLETFGVIKMDFKDENDKSLQPTGDIDISLDIDKYNITENEVENIKLWYLEEKTGRWRILDTSWKKHQTKRSKRSDKHISLFTTKLNAREFIRFDLNLDKVGGEIYLKVMAEDTTKKAESVLITVFVTQSRVNYRYQSYNIEPNKARCIKTFRTDEFAEIRAVVGDQYPLTPKETGLDEDVIKKSHRNNLRRIASIFHNANVK
ncbi:cartilage intermediate layer protein 1-like [Dendronephthya gigantea]|uniref:cartilage intermediate layer protein 1-like n=1 Tax=Dendronephthya gigantea TaxID=151771 RepID=UPI00106A7F30|nr:cartilage intermediate layer protein 1-like [Dendronephthya gigantea]